MRAFPANAPVLSVAVLALAAVLAACAARPAPPAGAPPVPVDAWRALGNEPFWSVRVQGGELVFATPEDLQGRRLRGTAAPLADGVRYQGRDGATGFSLEIRRGECSDTMSDRRYGWTSRFRYGALDYAGCAEPLPAPP